MKAHPMDTAHVDRLVNALLYEGYLLYPYRPSVKNTQRWTFGGLYPRAGARILRRPTHSGSSRSAS